ncbi:hypothetical protein [Streptomyces sp. AC602_WCS936]|uniref:hypothetical protein n=1 Tax=Streptomyces sp. AC602_WCS936 TaxID=2823685 RepID=UPI001C25A1DD|nr:hypothetical protein [Streptomyces sp. AC602_WCS936]
MTDLIGRLITWVSLSLRPRGAHRGTVPPPAILPTPDRPAVIPLPTHRSPYGLPTTLDGTETVAVRPYVLLPTPYELEAAA